MKHLLTIVSLLTAVNAFCQTGKISELCPCSTKDIDRSKIYYVGNGYYLIKTRCNGSSYLFYSNNKDLTEGAPLLLSVPTAHLSDKARISSKKPYGPNYVIIYDPNDGKSYKCTFEDRRITYIGKAYRTGDSNGAGRPR